MGVKLIDADTIVTVQFYDDEHGEYNFERMTIADALDCWTEEGCPPEVIAQEPVEPLRKPELFDSLYFCGKCSAKVGFQIRKDDSWRFKCNYCPQCGRKVKWE